MSDYLWDRSGRPDQELEHLEKLLGSARYQEPFAPPARAREPRRRSHRVLAAAACAAALIALGIMAWIRIGSSSTGTESAVSTVACQPSSPDAPWSVHEAKESTCGGAPIAGVVRLGTGAWLETGSHGAAEIVIGEIGRVTLAPNSRLRRGESDRVEHRLELAKGSLHAVIDAPPRIFVVETPSSTAVDLGCEYRLAVLPSGATRLEVLSGYVALVHGQAEIVVPAGYFSESFSGSGPTPALVLSASDALVEAVRRFVREPSGVLLTSLLELTGQDDTLLLWQLLDWDDGKWCGPVRDRLNILVPFVPVELPSKDCGDSEQGEAWREHLEPTWGEWQLDREAPLGTEGDSPWQR